MTDVHVKQAQDIFGVAQWSERYVDINQTGQVVVYPTNSQTKTPIVLEKLVKEIQAKGLHLPVLVRFMDILQHRIQELNNAFTQAQAQLHYHGGYTPVYPIKVNQQPHVVETILQTPGISVGLEAGSKPELMAVLALASQDKGVIVCNGYKDREYIQLALIGQQLGHRVYIIVEKLSELETVLAESKRMNVAPLLGFRVRLATLGAGKWQNTGGEKAKFGLSAAQILQGITQLRDANALSWLVALHCHMGSQIANIQDIHRGLQELVRYYAELRHMGVDIQCVDVGGGLGIDYEGTHSRSECSMNYTVEEYAQSVVQTFFEICQQQKLPQPHIMTETGRAMVAHHAVLISEIIDFESPYEIIETPRVNAQDPQVLQDLMKSLNHVTSMTATEVYYDAQSWLAAAHAAYVQGTFTLAHRATAEALYGMICRKVRGMLNPLIRSHKTILDELNEKLADKMICNFSVFQSLPDVWALEQVFPILPLSRLNEPLSERGVIHDLTCDSDGQIGSYVDNSSVEKTLPLPAFKPDHPYLLGFFLVGAYQEILGDLHNLFGDVNAINVRLNHAGGYDLEHAQVGNTVDDVLRYVAFDPQILLDIYRKKINHTALSEQDKAAYFAALSNGITSYTYLAP